MTLRAAHALGGIAATAFSRIRNADLEHFVVDRLITSRGGTHAALAKVRQANVSLSLGAAPFSPIDPS